MRRLLLAWAFLVVSVVTDVERWSGTDRRLVAADLPSQADDPYRVVVCLGFSDEPIFTRFFVESVQRQVRDQLANYFGALADVEVATELPPVAKAAASSPISLAGLSLAPADFAGDEFQATVFLVTVAFRDGVYKIEWRQASGDVQRLGALYRQTTPDRQWLAKAISLAVRRDFAPVARVDPASDGTSVRLDFRGANRGGPLASWFEDGCVLQPFWVLKQQDGSLASKPIPNTVLKIQQGTDWTKATVLTGLANPWKRTARVAGFRAVKLTTQTGRFRLRLVTSEDGSPTQTCIVYASSDGFEETTDADRLPGPDREGYVVATRDFNNLAYVTVRQNKTYRLLVPITEDWCLVEWRLSVDELSGQRSDWQRQLNYCVQDIKILGLVVDECVRDVNELNQNKRYEEALKRVKSALQSLRPMIAAAQAGVGGVQAQAKDVKMSDNSLLAWVRGQIDQLRKRETQLGELATDLENTINNIDAQSRAKVLLKLAGEAEQAGDIDDAIGKYDLALQEWPNQPQVKEHVDQLREDWRIKGPEHALHEEARRFVYETYAAARADEVAPLVGGARDAFRVLAGVDDYLAATKLLRANERYVAELTEILDALADRGGAADRAEGDRYGKLLQEILDFQEKVVAYGAAREGRLSP